MAPCGWAVGSCGCGECWDKHTPATRERAENMAALILYAATGRQYGPCEITVQPTGRCAPDPLYRTYGQPGGGLSSPFISGGSWYNGPYLGDSDAATSCCTSNGCEVDLDGPTRTSQIVSVSLGEETLDEGAYVVMDGRSLVRTDGACWPCCTNFSSQDPPGFAVTYLIGLPIPPALQGAFERLACETVKACAGGVCGLPARITRLSRQGVEMEIEQVPVDERGMTLTGIKDVDDVILAFNPYRLTQAPQVLTPDLPRPRRVT